MQPAKSGPMLQHSVGKSTNHKILVAHGEGGLQRLALTAVWKSPQSADSPPTRCVVHASRAQRNPQTSAVVPVKKTQRGGEW